MLSLLLIVAVAVFGFSGSGLADVVTWHQHIVACDAEVSVQALVSASATPREKEKTDLPRTIAFQGVVASCPVAAEPSLVPEDLAEIGVDSRQAWRSSAVSGRGPPSAVSHW